MKTAKILKYKKNLAVQEWVKDKDEKEIVNEIITVSFIDSPVSTRHKFEQGSTASDKDCYIRMMHDFIKHLNKKYENRVIDDFLPSRKEFMAYLLDLNMREIPEFMSKIQMFSSDLSERDKELISFSLHGDELPATELSEKYGIKEDSIYRAEYRLLKRLRDFLNVRVIAREIPLIDDEDKYEND